MLSELIITPGLPNLQLINLESNNIAGLDKSVFSSLVTISTL